MKGPFAMAGQASRNGTSLGIAFDDGDFLVG